MKTWHVENAAVASVLLAVWWSTGHTWEELLGSLAVFCGFCCSSITDRLTEREAARQRPTVHCYRLYWYFFVIEELCWAIYFARKGAWSAEVGVGTFLLYPFWRKFWRRIHPMREEPGADLVETCKLYDEGILSGSELFFGLRKAGIPDSLIELMENLHGESCERAQTVKELRPLLNSVITESLFISKGEPDANQKWSAAYAFTALKKLGAPIDAEEEVRARLAPGIRDGEPNPDETDYLACAAKSLIGASPCL